jgi:hypothetical protein
MRFPPRCHAHTITAVKPRKFTQGRRLPKEYRNIKLWKRRLMRLEERGVA